MRLVVTVDDYDAAVAFYRDVLGLPERESYSSEDGRVTILDVERATLELADRNQAEFIDRVEVGQRVAGKYRVAFEVADSAVTTQELADSRRDSRRRADSYAVELAERPPRGPGRHPADAVHRA